MSEYNGYTNRETWQAALWLDEWDAYRVFREYDGEITPDDVRDFVEVNIEDSYDDSNGVVCDIINGWFGSVNWQELATDYNDTFAGEG